MGSVDEANRQLKPIYLNSCPSHTKLGKHILIQAPWNIKNFQVATSSSVNLLFLFIDVTHEAQPMLLELRNFFSRSHYNKSASREWEHETLVHTNDGEWAVKTPSPATSHLMKKTSVLASGEKAISVKSQFNNEFKSPSEACKHKFDHIQAQYLSFQWTQVLFPRSIGYFFVIKTGESLACPIVFQKIACRIRKNLPGWFSNNPPVLHRKHHML